MPLLNNEKIFSSFKKILSPSATLVLPTRADEMVKKSHVLIFGVKTETN